MKPHGTVRRENDEIHVSVLPIPSFFPQFNRERRQLIDVGNARDVIPRGFDKFFQSLRVRQINLAGRGPFVLGQGRWHGAA